MDASQRMIARRRRRSRGNKKKLAEESSEIVVLDNKNIPQDLVDDILIRLPVKSFFRFKAVSKLWHATISDPSFYWRRRPASRIFAMVHKSCRGLLFNSIDEKGSVEKFELPPPDWYQKEFDSNKKNHAVISNSCNGMLLLRLGTEIYLLNPSTHYIRNVLTLKFEWYEVREPDIEMGFCYDESIGDYKAVIIRFFRSSISYVKVASFKEKKWTVLRTLRKNFYSLSPRTLVNDRLHAIVHIGNDQYVAQYDIVYFNPISNVFVKVPCLKPKSDEGNAILGLGVLEGCLCMARRVGESDFKGGVKVLIMKEYGVAKSWTTLFVLKDFGVNRFSGRMNLLLKTDDGDILIKNEGKIWRYNLANKSCTEFIQNGNVYRKDAVTFAENLISPRTVGFM